MATLTFQKQCPGCKKWFIIENIDWDGWEKFQNGDPIEECFPDIDPNLRELFVSGWCGECKANKEN